MSDSPTFDLKEADIPDEIWLAILTFLTSHPRYLNKVRLISRRFKRYCEEDHLWFLTYKATSPNLSHGIAYQSFTDGGLTWKEMFQDHWRSLQSWSEYTPKSLLYQLPFCSSKFGPQWRHLVQSDPGKEFHYVSRRLVEDYKCNLVGYGGCVQKKQYNVLIWSQNDWKPIGNYKIAIEGEEHVELISVNSERGIFVVAYNNDQQENEWGKIQLYHMDNIHEATLLAEFRTQMQAHFQYGSFDVPYCDELGNQCESDPNAFTLFGIEPDKEYSMFCLRFNYLTGELMTKKYYKSNIQVVNYHPAKADHLLFGTTNSGCVHVWDLRNDRTWQVTTNGAVNPWGTEPTILFNHAIDKQAIKMITVGDNEIDSNHLVLWELQDDPSSQQAQLIYQIEVQSRDGVFGSYCVHGSCLLGLTYDGTIMVYQLENLRKLASIPIPSKYDFCKQSSPEKLYDISVNDANQIVVCTSRGLFMLPLPTSDSLNTTMFMVGS
ncbi:hypothetical protein K7432_015240 [Basidiobolus ranarum]|uniref:F-box domain-containing protein n=1 Tax=Basidiobolus ranarum TaxID=34480 RepID=A0ABR2WGM6_9FUNG